MAAMFAKGQIVDRHCHKVMPDFVKALKRHNAQMDKNFAVPQWGAESVMREPGVVAIYPMVQQLDSCQIRILEIYRDMDAYRQHIASDHFQTYKQGTLHMVKSLDLVDMRPLYPADMPLIFRKIQ